MFLKNQKRILCAHENDIKLKPVSMYTDLLEHSRARGFIHH